MGRSLGPRMHTLRQLSGNFPDNAAHGANFKLHLTNGAQASQPACASMLFKGLLCRDKSKQASACYDTRCSVKNQQPTGMHAPSSSSSSSGTATLDLHNATSFDNTADASSVYSITESLQQQQYCGGLNTFEQQLSAWQADGVCFPVCCTATNNKANESKATGIYNQQQQDEQRQQQQQCRAASGAVQQQQQQQCIRASAHAAYAQELLKKAARRISLHNDNSLTHINTQQQQQHVKQQQQQRPLVLLGNNHVAPVSVMGQPCVVHGGLNTAATCQGGSSSSCRGSSSSSSGSGGGSTSSSTSSGLCVIERALALAPAAAAAAAATTTVRSPAVYPLDKALRASMSLQMSCSAQHLGHSQQQQQQRQQQQQPEAMGYADLTKSQYSSQNAAASSVAAAAVDVAAPATSRAYGAPCRTAAAAINVDPSKARHLHATSSQINAAAGAAVGMAPGRLTPRPPHGTARQRLVIRPGVQLKNTLAAAAAGGHHTAAAAYNTSGRHTQAASTAATDESDEQVAKNQQQQQQQQQQGRPAGREAPSEAAAAAAGAPTAGCVLIAVARHCPKDIHAQQWQPSDFVRSHTLYEGKIAAVFQGCHAASGRPLALKVYNRARLDIMERFQLAREVCLHMRSRHPFITSLYAAYKDTRHIYLLMELAPKGNLYQMLMALPVPVGCPKCLDEGDAVVRVIKPLLSALAYLHDQGIIHRDIKLENVLLTADGCIKLADFGLSIDTRHEPANTRLGTQGYFAPEVLSLPLKSSPFEGKSPSEAAARPSYDCKVDVWSAGVVCYEVLTGRAPFAAESPAQVLKAILQRNLVYPAHLSPAAVDFLSAALTRDPAARPTSQQLLHHPFITWHDDKA